jgi:putative ABC transport system permease protein
MTIFDVDMNAFPLKLAIRKLLRQRSFTLINLGGLTISLAACIVILVYASYEQGFDKKIPNYERTYRIISRLTDGKYWSRSFACYTDALSNRPEIENMTSFIYTNNNELRVGESDYNVSESVIADTAFLDFFNVECIAGRKEDLGQPNTVFLDSELAERLFPGGNAYGQEILLRQYEGNVLDSLGLFTVAGIIKPFPGNTHFSFQMIFSQQGNFNEMIGNLKDGKFFAANVYLRLFDEAQVANLEADLTDVLAPFLGRSQGPPIEAFHSRLQPVREIHFTSDLNRELKPVISKSVLYLLFNVGGLILILLCMNFLSTAIVQALRQRKETGIMRTLGANNFELFSVSLSKIFIFVGAGLVLSWFIIFLAGTWLEVFFGSGWEPRKSIAKILLYSLAAGCFVIIVAASGMHLMGARRSVVELLKGKLPSGGKLFGIFGVLTVVQFGIVVFLIGFSMMIGKQLRFLDHKDLGYTSENVYIVRIPSPEPRGIFLLEEIRRNASVVSASTVHHHPGDVFQHMDFAVGQSQYPFEFRMVDQDIFNTLDIKLIKNFSPGQTNMEGWVINETFYKILVQDFSEEIVAGSNFNVMEENAAEDGRTRFKIAGVMKDFHYSSLYDRIGPFAFAIRNPESLYNRWLVVRFRDGQSTACMSAVNEMMERHFPGRQHDGFLLSEMLKNKYASSRKLAVIIRLFTLLSILIAGFGLYGLSLYITQQRTKEIGIRKVFGASQWRVISLLNLGFLKWVVISFVVACPFTLWALKKWLINFAYKATPSVWIFLLTGLIVTTIAVVSVTWQTASAAGRNPVDAIRYE